MKNLLDKKVIELLEYRIQQEEFSARLYKDMSNWFKVKGLGNLANVYMKYSGEERSHAGWASEFLMDFNYKPTLKPLLSPESKYSGVKEILDATLEHELEITKQCQELATEALKMNEHILYSLALKYVDEQREEIDKSLTFIDIYENSDNDLFFDHYIGENYLD